MSVGSGSWQAARLGNRLPPKLLLALVILDAGSEPEMYLIPASAWRNPKPPFADRDYDGPKSPPEYGLTLLPSAMLALEPFRFAGAIPGLSAADTHLAE